MEEQKLLTSHCNTENGNEEDSMHSDVEGFFECPSHPMGNRRSWIKCWPWIAHTTLFLLSSGMLARSVAMQRTPPAGFLEARRQWTITMGSIPEQIHFERSRGTLNRSSSPFKGPPSAAVDSAWDEMTDYGALVIPEEVYEKLNASKNAVKIPSEHGGGRQGYLEVFHQLHCLRSLWRHTYPDYYTEVAEQVRKNNADWHDHIDHCTEMLRQKIVCDADVQILTYNWVQGHDWPHANFNIPRQCRNFEDIKRYALDHAMDGSSLIRGRLEKPKDGSVREYIEPPFDPLDDGKPSQ